MFGTDIGVAAARNVSGTGTRGRALVVDDDLTNRLLLKALLDQEGYEVVQAEDGVQAVGQFEENLPDIVFMDVMMPRMDGYEATRRIKALTADRFVPVVFLTALVEEDALAKCIEAGGDDFLTKPFKHTILRAKVTAVERMRDLYRKVKAQHEEMSVLHGRMQREQEIAEQIFSNAVAARNVALDRIHTLLRPAATFNGDILLTARRPSGELNVLLGDFTGHGLTAAVGALPVSEVFRAMTAKGFAAGDILKEINHKLCFMLPTGMFLAACFLTVDPELRALSVWNGGIPEVLVVSHATGRIRRRIPSTHLPLGITDSLETELTVHREEIGSGDRILLYSDGLIEARSPSGEMFGELRLERVVEGGEAQDVFARVVHALESFCQGQASEDDITLVDIPCERVLIATEASAGRSSVAESHDGFAGVWRWAFEVHGPGLHGVDPVPLAIAQLQEIHGLGAHRESLYTVLFELFTNALDHGLLGLRSDLKESAEGFTRYYAEREQRLARLRDGYVRIELMHVPQGAGGRLVICMEDSGKGFDYDVALSSVEDGLKQNSGYCGRGIPLVRSLCESLEYKGPGNRVEAVYEWSS